MSLYGTRMQQIAKNFPNFLTVKPSEPLLATLCLQQSQIAADMKLQKGGLGWGESLRENCAICCILVL